MPKQQIITKLTIRVASDDQIYIKKDKGRWASIDAGEHDLEFQELKIHVEYDCASAGWEFTIRKDNNNG